MKKIYLSLFVALLTAGIAGAQCTIDSTAQTTPGANPMADQLPCIEKTVAYNETVQGKIQAYQDTSFTIAGFAINAHIVVDSVQIDSIAGLPTGINWTKNPDILYGGGNGCVNFSGTTTDTAGTYPLTAFGTAWLRIQVTNPIAIDTPYVIHGNLNRYSPFGDYYVVVINQGAPCVHPTTGIKDFSKDLNTVMNVYPNPNNGSFEVSLNTGSRVNGSLNVIDMTGRTVYSQNLDIMGLYSTHINLTTLPKGIYTVQLKSAEGVTAKNISIQ